jgi:DNA-binding LytR/AlgR family response regulator
VLKPVNRAKLNEILSRCYRIWKRIQKDEVMVKGKNGMTTVTVRNIMYVENNARCAVYHMRDKSVVTSVCNRGKFEDAIAPLPERPQFIRPHKSYLVNMDYIDEFGVEEIKLDDETIIPVSRNQRNDVKHRYLQYYTEESESVDLR